MEKQVIFTNKAPEPIGPYNQAILVNDVLYVSGQIAIDPESKDMVSNSIKDETRQVMRNLEAILVASNMTFLNVVKCSIFLKNMADFSIVNEIYGEFFKENPPARETIEVSKLPKNANVEISCIAVT